MIPEVGIYTKGIKQCSLTSGKVYYREVKLLSHEWLKIATQNYQNNKKCWLIVIGNSYPGNKWFSLICYNIWSYVWAKNSLKTRGLLNCNSNEQRVKECKNEKLKKQNVTWNYKPSEYSRYGCQYYGEILHILQTKKIS